MAQLLTDADAPCPPLDDLLPSLRLFAGLDPDALAEVCRTAEPFALAAGALLFEQDDPGDGAYIVGSGQLSVFGRTPGDQLRLVTTVSRQGIIGEFCLLDGGRRSAEARADVDTRGYRIDLDKFSALRAAGRPAAFVVLRHLQAEVARRTRVAIAEIAAIVPPEAAQEMPPPALPAGNADAAECAALLHSFPGMERLKPDDWQEFAAQARRLQLARGEVIEPGARPYSALYCVARGALRTRLPGAPGSPQLLIHGPGTLAGAAAMVEGGDWPAMLDVREDAIVYAIPAAAFTGIARPQSPLATRLFDRLGQQLTSDLRRISRARTRLDHVAANAGRAG